MRNNLETKLGEKLFLIADARDRASEISFYLHDKRAEGPGHPPVYIPESQDMVNQFSFWPRYDEFVELKPGAPRPEGEVYTEENGINLFVGRDALFVRDGKKQRVPHNIKAGFQSTELDWHHSSIALWEAAANLADISLSKLPDTSSMNEVTSSPAFSVVVPLYNEEANLPILQEELRVALSGLDYEIVFVDDGSVDRTRGANRSCAEYRV